MGIIAITIRLCLTGEQIPRLPYALCSKELRKWQAKRFRELEGKRKSSDYQLVEALLAGHPDADRWLKQLSAPADSVDDMTKALLTASLLELDPDNKDAFKKESKRFVGAGSDTLRDYVAERMGPDFDEGKAKDIIDRVAAEARAETKLPPLRSTPIWAAALVPPRADAPPDTERLALDRIARKDSWTSYYERPKAVNSTMPPGFKQNSKTKAFGTDKTGTEHDALKVCVLWLWDRHKLFVPTVVAPAHVARFLAACDRCPSGTCDGSHQFDASGAPLDEPLAAVPGSGDEGEGASSSTSSTSSDSSSSS